MLATINASDGFVGPISQQSSYACLTCVSRRDKHDKTWCWRLDVSCHKPNQQAEGWEEKQWMVDRNQNRNRQDHCHRLEKSGGESYVYICTRFAECVGQIMRARLVKYPHIKVAGNRKTPAPRVVIAPPTTVPPIFVNWIWPNMIGISKCGLFVFTYAHSHMLAWLNSEAALALHALCGHNQNFLACLSLSTNTHSYEWIPQNAYARAPYWRRPRCTYARRGYNSPRKTCIGGRWVISSEIRGSASFTDHYRRLTLLSMSCRFRMDMYSCPMKLCVGK